MNILIEEQTLIQSFSMPFRRKMASTRFLLRLNRLAKRRTLNV